MHQGPKFVMAPMRKDNAKAFRKKQMAALRKMKEEQSEYLKDHIKATRTIHRALRGVKKSAKEKD